MLRLINTLRYTTITTTTTTTSINNMVKWTPTLKDWYQHHFKSIIIRSNQCKSHCRLLSTTTTSLHAKKSNNDNDITTKRRQKKQRIVIRASDVAAIIGKNQYKPPYEVFDDMWKRFMPATFEGKVYFLTFILISLYPYILISSCPYIL
jgi:hypothetical protein